MFKIERIACTNADLVADDHEVVRKGVCMILMAHFIQLECIEVSTGQEAIEKRSNTHLT
jgi:hypothetical protein